MSNGKIKVSAVSYLNSKPFIYGLQNSSLINEIDLQLDVPSTCAEKLENNSVDIGLIPVIAIPDLNEHYIISDYCIGADGEVGSVLLLSDVPLEEIKTVLLDYQSRTSVVLAQVLAKKYWNIKPQWIDANENFENKISGSTAGVVIGDRTFSLKNKFRFTYDLSAEWKKFTSLPFVFACWVSNKKLPKDFIQCFNDSLKYGLENKNAVIKQYSSENISMVELKDYLENKVSFDFDNTKKNALELFLKYAEEIQKADLMKII